jgi:hypothetical protein|tara:strand:- start:57 stop:2045 length:1989 start_codon:yes stop_codon:yes gene_type:complete
MTSEEYGQYIDDFELGADVIPGESLTDYIERRRREFESKADGGAIGIEVLFTDKKPRKNFFMGGPALEGQALNIYNSMNAYGFTDQEIADALSARGLYTPGGSTQPEQVTGIIGSQLNQGGGDKPMIQPFKQDPRVGSAFEAYQRNQALSAMDINDPFANEATLAGAYYGDMPNVNLGPGKQTLGGKIKSGIGEVMNFPLVKGMSLMSPIGLAKQGLTFLKDKLPVNQRAIAENVAGNMGIAVDDVGRIVNTGNYADPDNIMAGYNLNKLTDESFDKRIDRTSKTLSEKYGLNTQQISDILSGKLTEEDFTDDKFKLPGTKKTTNLIKQLRSLNIAKDRNKFIQETAQKEAERQRQIKEQAKLARQLKRAEKEIAAKGYQDYGQGAADEATQKSYEGSDGSYAGASTQDYGSGEKDGGIIGYQEGGRVGLFMGGPALTGQPALIYESMKKYGFSDQEIANAIKQAGYDLSEKETSTTTTPITNTAPNIINQGSGYEDRFNIDSPNTFDKGFSSINFNLGPNKDVVDYEAEAYGIGPTFKGTFARALTALKNIPTPFNIARMGIEKAIEFSRAKKEREKIAAAKAAAELKAKQAIAEAERKAQEQAILDQAYQTQTQTQKEAGGGPGGQFDGADSKADYDANPTGYSGSFNRGGLATMFTRRR